MASVQVVEEEVDEAEFIQNSKLSEVFDKMKKEASMNKDFTKDMDKIKANLIDSKYLNEDGSLNESKALAKGELADLKAWSLRNPSVIAEFADNGKFRLFERTSRYDDPGEIYVTKRKIETAEDDRVLGIPYAQAMAGDRVYIINGKVFTGWALYFSLSSIKSPEDYARNVDLVFNVPYLFSSILLKAQLGLGCGFDAVYGSEANDVAEEKLIQRYLFKKLKINTQKLVKTGFHLFTYGNAYWALRRDKNNLVDKITILQPERLKIFLDPMTTRIMFYIYLPPIIGGTTIASYPSDGRFNPNILTGTTLSYPTPIVMHPEDVCHFKVNDFTEYPFGFSDVKSCVDPATARLDVNILAPILYKKYAKPMIHWQLNTEGIGPKQITDKQNEMTALLENMEPGSDPVTTDRWTSTLINVSQSKGSILELTSDIDTQIFAATGAPETYFKPKGSTDRMISEQDKTFISRLKVPQEIVGDQIEERLIIPRIYHELKEKHSIRVAMGTEDPVEKILDGMDSWLASEPRIPELQWKEIFKSDETQSIANAIALLNAGIIDRDQAAMRLGITSPSEQMRKDKNTTGIDDPLDLTVKKNSAEPKEQENTPDNYNEQENMEMMRGGLKTGAQFDDANRNETHVKDPSQLGGSRYAQHALKGKEADIKEKHFQDGDEIETEHYADGIFIKKK